MGKIKTFFFSKKKKDVLFLYIYIYMYKTDYQPPKRDEILPFVATGMDLEGIMLNEIN